MLHPGPTPFESTPLPRVEVSQYVSPDRQMSLSSDEEEAPSATRHWMLHPRWRNSCRPNYTSMPPDIAIQAIYEQFACAEFNFFLPRALDFVNGKPTENQGFTDILCFKWQSSVLMDALTAIRVPPEHQKRHTEVKDLISGRVKQVDDWVEEQRQLALREDEELSEEFRRMRLEEKDRMGIDFFLSRILRPPTST
ncbi:hypothetical protein RhiJN_00339 [Ceratobasidium sp. AG-Ba]|nr:hypothetical protein RhiJN_00339 [Ceratobasidium sp. AG-Ba]QRW01367.1 hypothetical protein RhiLY_00364 [Ceratobasidium sp. AG-Ba]